MLSKSTVSEFNFLFSPKHWVILTTEDEIHLNHISHSFPLYSLTSLYDGEWECWGKQIKVIIQFYSQLISFFSFSIFISQTTERVYPICWKIPKKKVKTGTIFLGLRGSNRRLKLCLLSILLSTIDLLIHGLWELWYVSNLIIFCFDSWLAINQSFTFYRFFLVCLYSVWAKPMTWF